MIFNSLQAGVKLIDYGVSSHTNTTMVYKIDCNLVYLFLFGCDVAPIFYL
jgi:hypothetical protein